jgi:hypothetical protein
MKEKLKEIEKYAEENSVPIIEKNSIAFIMKYIQDNSVKNILSSSKDSESIKILKEAEIKNLIDTSRRMLENKDYTNALEYINEADYSAKQLEEKNIYSDEIISLKKNILPFEVNNQIGKARENAKKGDYSQAIDILVNVGYINEDMKLSETITSLKDKYLALQEKKLKKEKKSRGVSIGMTTEEVLQSSWGKPKDINKTITDYGTREQWVYANYNYLYFEDGILVTIQN